MNPLERLQKVIADTLKRLAIKQSDSKYRVQVEVKVLDEEGEPVLTLQTELH